MRRMIECEFLTNYTKNSVKARLNPTKFECCNTKRSGHSSVMLFYMGEGVEKANKCVT